MMSNESLYPPDWLRVAERDWRGVEYLLDADDPELAGLCLQQAVEKFLKAFLLSRGWRLRRIHNLDTILDDAVLYDTSLEKFRGSCQKITAFYVAERYPFLLEGSITREDVRNSLEEVGELIQKLRTSVSER
jgi:HEPN domain-containing protein